MAFQLQAEGPVQKVRDSLLHQLSTSGGPTLSPLRIWGPT